MSLCETEEREQNEEEKAWEGGSQDECYELLAKTMPKTADNHQILGETHGIDSPSKPPGGTKVAGTFISDF